MAVAVAVAVAAVAGAAALLTSLAGDDPEPAAGAPANSLVLLDAASGEVRATFDVGGTPTSVAVGEGAAWVLNADDQTISRVDARSHAIRTFGSGGVPTDLAAGSGALWAGNGHRTGAQFVGPVMTSVARLDASSTAVRAVVSLPRARGYTSNLQQDHIAVASNAVWVVNPDASVSAIDPATNKLAAVVRGLRAGAVSVGDGQVWALGLDSSLVRIDPRRRAVQRRIRVAAGSLSAIAVGGGAVWAADPYEGTVWRVDPEPRLVQRTIDVGVGVSDVAYGLGGVWALNGLRGTLTRIDPRTNRVTATIAVGNTPRQVAVGAGGLWVTVAGSAGAPVPAARAASGASALPASTCGRLFGGADDSPERLIVSDMPMRGGSDVPTVQMSEAIAYVLRQRGFRAGRFTVGYQACDDSTAQTGIFDQQKCAANAKLYASTPAVIGVVGPYNSGCAVAQIPIANTADGGPLAMISPTNSDIGLTRATPITPEGLPARLYPSGKRNYVRVFPREDVHAEAVATFARDRADSPRRGAQRRRIWRDDGVSFRAGRAPARCRGRARAALAPRCAGIWPSGGHGRPRPPDAVFLSGLIDSNGGRLVKDLRRRLPHRTDLIGTDGFLPVARLFAAAGAAARGMYLSTSELPLGRLPREGKHFVTGFAATQGGRAVHPASVYAAQAADVLLDAIAASDGSRASVVAKLRSGKGDAGAARQLRVRRRRRCDPSADDGRPRAPRRRLDVRAEHRGRRRRPGDRARAAAGLRTRTCVKPATPEPAAAPGRPPRERGRGR